MTVKQFREFLLQLAKLHEKNDEKEEAAALQKLAEIFDDTKNLKVDRFLEQIRCSRQLTAA